MKTISPSSNLSPQSALTSLMKLAKTFLARIFTANARKMFSTSSAKTFQNGKSTFFRALPFLISSHT